MRGGIAIALAILILSLPAIVMGEEPKKGDQASATTAGSPTPFLLDKGKLAIRSAQVDAIAASQASRDAQSVLRSVMDSAYREAGVDPDKFDLCGITINCAPERNKDLALQPKPAPPTPNKKEPAK